METQDLMIDQTLDEVEESPARAALRLAARGDLDGPVVTVLPDAWDRYRATPWMKAWST